MTTGPTLQLGGDRVLVIAEIGSCHDGDLDRALALIDTAADCGADVAKFQSFLANEMLAPGDPDYDLLKRLEMPRDWYPQLRWRCRERGLHFLSTATNFTTLEWMEALEAVAYKIASGNITHTPLIDHLLIMGKPLIVSTGLATLEEIKALAARFRTVIPGKYAFLHCISHYPALPEQSHLGNIAALRELLDCPVGFSDHSPGIHLPVAAVALGACIIEKHLTDGAAGFSPDHTVALAPDAFRAMTQAIRDTEIALDTDFSPNRKGMATTRRSLHFARTMAAGETVGEDDLAVIRPEDGLPPSALGSVVGRQLTCDVTSGSPVREDALGPAGGEARNG